MLKQIGRKEGIKCSCGKQVSKIIYKNGKKTCQYCNPKSLSGQFDRRIGQERQKYQRDILQPGQSGFKEIYGTIIKIQKDIDNRLSKIINETGIICL